MKLLDAQTANIADSAVLMDWPGGVGNVVCEGTFDTCSVTLEAQWDGGAWHTIDTFAAAEIANFTLRKGFKLRGGVSSVGAGTTVSLHAISPSMG